MSDDCQVGSKRGIAVLDAPSNLGLRAPAPGLVPGRGQPEIVAEGPAACGKRVAAGFEGLVGPLLAAPGCVGVQLTIHDPDLDPEGRYAALLAGTLVGALS